MAQRAEAAAAAAAMRDAMLVEVHAALFAHVVRAVNGALVSCLEAERGRTAMGEARAGLSAREQGQGQGKGSARGEEEGGQMLVVEMAGGGAAPPQGLQGMLDNYAQARPHPSPGPHHSPLTFTLTTDPDPNSNPDPNPNHSP